MIKKFILLVFISSVVFGAEQDCEQYFEARKAQIELQTREFDEARQSLEAYKASFEALQKERLENLEKKEVEVNATLAKIEGRVKEIYSQMKDAAIADVLSQMDAEDASKIMLSLESRKISGVLSKMDPKKASELTLLLKNLDNNASN